MKLVSNFKDYYDYLIGTYGIDPKAVYERVCQTEMVIGKKKIWQKSALYKPKYLEPGARYSFDMIGFCGTIYCVYSFDGKFYFGRDCDNIPKSFDKYRANASGWDFTNSIFHLQQTDVNEYTQCPVVVIRRSNNYDEEYPFPSKPWPWNDWRASVLNPKLSDFGFPSIIPADECFMRITNFLLREKEIKDNRTDKEKIASKGFDVKTSFRNM